MPRFARRNLLALAVLSYLVRGPMHPYELGRTLRHNGDARSIRFNHGSLYMVFGQLERAGLVAAQGTSREGQRPERTVYALTPEGREEQRSWLRALVEEPEHEYPQFVAALSLIGALHPDDAVDLLRRRLGRLEAKRVDISRLRADALAAGVHELFLVEEHFRAAMLDAETAFVEQLVDRITDPDNGWREPWAQAQAAASAPPEEST